MKPENAQVARIRPVSWKVFVASRKGVDYVRDALCNSGMDCSEANLEPELPSEPIFSFVATAKQKTPLTALELQAIFDHDDIEIAFES